MAPLQNAGVTGIVRRTDYSAERSGSGRLFTFEQSRFEQPPPQERAILAASSGGISMNRNPDASLSPQELMSLRRVGLDSRQPIPATHQYLLASMNLIRSVAGVLIVTDQGRQRLRTERPQASEWQQPGLSSNDA